MKKILFLFLFISFSNKNFAQSVIISPNGTSAIIDANSTTKGFLPPRMTTAQRGGLTLTTGLEVFCTDCSPAGPYSYDGTKWLAMFNVTSGSVAIYSVGQQAQGGTVIWVDDSGQHGLVAAPVDVNVFPLPWSVSPNTNTYAVAMSGGIYGGATNTEKIVAQNGWNTYAAFICRQMTFGNYGDWYLPSLAELSILYQNKNLLSGLTTGGGTFPVPDSGFYWTSTESNQFEAYAITFINGQSVSLSKSSANTNQFGIPYRARAVRKF